MKLGRRLAMAVLILAGLFGVLVTPAGADDIGAPGNPCDAGYLCVYWDSHYGGSRSQFYDDNDSWSGWSIEDDDSSSYNNGLSGMSAEIRTGTYGGGSRVVFLWQYSWASHHSPGDSGSSNYWCWC